jgi:hypothetical protein
MDMPHGAWTFGMDVQHGQQTWPCGMDMQHIDMQHGHVAQTCRMNMDMDMDMDIDMEMDK